MAHLREEIGKAQGGIVLLVTMFNSGNESAARDAEKMLEKLSDSDQNIVGMAEANYFRPLAEKINSGKFFMPEIFQHIKFVYSCKILDF